MASRHESRSYLKPTTVSSVTSGHSYHFASMANSENDVSEEEAEEYELRPRGREKTRRSTSRERLDDIIFINKDIIEGETLISIALQHCCSVADLKRANNLINEQDFFALRSIKIPVKRFSLLTETHFYPKEKISRTVFTQLPLENQENYPALEALSTETVDSFLQEVDRDIEQIVRVTDMKKENLDDMVSALTQEPHFETEPKAAQQKDPYHGADWGLGWWTAVVIMIVVGIITPVFYLLYYEVLNKEPPSNSSHGK
ncbi:lysM and putative peptidoglycan-binding domain-containing protein 3 isoform X2 [Hyla sarda]|nr:lysM and putative peptidoglycan-binding domain-containing protein 3 isoform X2 [Hyla sarda]XP_056394361.1 lysM and putative peptidoglycan-binding domain-containing protein 3 isoform X2 [Hyla sarda]